MNQVIQPSTSSPHNQEVVVKEIHSHQVYAEKPEEIKEKHVQQPQVNVSERVINETVQEKPLAEEIKTIQAQQTVEEKTNAKAQQIKELSQEAPLIQEVQQLSAVRANAQKKHEQEVVAGPRHMEGNIKQQQEKPHTNLQKTYLNVDINPLSSLIIFKPQENQGQAQVVLPAYKQQIKTEIYQRVRQIQRPLDGQNTYEGQESKNTQDGLQKIARNIHHTELVQTIEHKEDESISNHQQIVFEHPIQTIPQQVSAKQPSQVGKVLQQQPEVVIPQQNQIKIAEEPTTNAQQPHQHEERIELKHQNALQISNEADILSSFQHKPQQVLQESKSVQKPNENESIHQKKAQQSENQKGQVIQPKQQQTIEIMHSQGTKQKMNISATHNQQPSFVEKNDIQHAENKQIVNQHPKETNSHNVHVKQAPSNAVITHTPTQQPLMHNKQPIQLEFKQKIQQRQQAHQEQAKSQQKEVIQNHHKQTAPQNASPAAHKKAIGADLPEHLEIKQVIKFEQHTLPKGQNESNGQINQQQSHNEEKSINNEVEAHEMPNQSVEQQKIQEIPAKIDAQTYQHIQKKGIIQVVQHQVKIESALNESQHHKPQQTEIQEHHIQIQPSCPKLIEKQQTVVINHQKEAEQKASDVYLASNNQITVEKRDKQQTPVTKMEQKKEQVSHQHPVIKIQDQRSQIIKNSQHNQHISSKNNDQTSLLHKYQSVKGGQNDERSQPVTQKEQLEGKQRIQINIIKIESDQEFENQNEVTFKEQKIDYLPEQPSEKGQTLVQDIKEPEQKHEQSGQHHLNQVEKSQKQQVQHINALKPTQNIQHISAMPQNHQEERVSSAIPQATAHETSNVVNAQHVQNVQPTKQCNIFDQPHIDDIQVEQRQGYKFNTQNMETIQEQKPKDRQVVEFIEFHQQQKIKSPHQPLPTHKQQPKQHASLQPTIKQHHQNIAVAASNNPPVQKGPTLKTIDVIHQQISQQKSPNFRQTIINKDGVGKIARKNVGEKRVNDVIEEMKKYDQKQPKKQPRPTSRRRKVDASKVEHISLKSNIISVTVGQILSKDDHVQADKLLDQIGQLKKKLFQLEKRKELAQMETIQKAQAAQKDTIMTNKSHKKILTGKIYKRADSNNSRVTEEVQTQGYATQKNNSIAVSSAPRQRFSSTQDFSAPKTASKQAQLDNKTGPVIFRVKKNNKTIHGPFDFNLNEKEPLFVKSKEFQTEEKGFQARRQDYERLEFQQQEKLHVLEKPSPRKLVFDENFKELTDRFFIQLDDESPKKEWDQEELVQTARQTFKKFGINIQAQKHVTLSVKKYKNCVSFILDSNRTILWYYQGKFYFGGWKINRSGQGEKSGWGYDYSPGKYVFSGSFVENKRDGYGVIKLLTRQNDTIYEGGWKNGFKHGHGKQRQVDETQYIGEWAQGKKNGKGKIKGSNGQYFDGTFLSGVKNGEGVQKFKNGDSYEGNYYDGKFHGMGVYIWANLSKYQGQFKEGSRNGNGIWVSNHTTENTDRYEGQYKNDRKNGFGVYRWKDGTVYQGQFLNDLKHGEGIVSYGDGKSTKLQWYEGNVVSKQSGDKQRISKRSISKSSSKKGEEKGSQTKSPLIKFNIGHESKLKPTRLSFGVEQF